MQKATFFPEVTVTDKGDGTAEVTFRWEGSLHENDIDSDDADERRLSDAIDHWQGRPEKFIVPINKDKRIVQKKPVV